MSGLQKVDHSALRTNQAFVILLNLLAFVFDLPAIVLATGVVMLLGSTFRRPGFGFIYSFALRPLKIARPDVLEDHPEPHRFAQTFGAAVLLIGAGLLFFGPAGIGWGLVWLVIALAALNLFGGFCVGCAVYYWLNRMQMPGFYKSPPPETRPGMRPRALK